jgi:hypothetical protein
LVEVYHVVRVDIAKKTADFVVLNNVPDIKGHGYQQHGRRAEKHALYGEL